MSLSFANGASNAMVDALTDLLDGGTIEVRSGSKPSSPSDAATGTLLATFTLPSPSFGTSASKVATLGTVSSTTAASTGTAGYFRAKSSGGTAYVDGTVSAAGGGGDLILSSTSLTSGGSVSISGTLTGP